MTRLLIICLLVFGTCTAKAVTVIRNNNTDEGYSMHVTYRLCHFNDMHVYVCDDPQQVVVAKGSDYLDTRVGMLVIDKATLMNDQDNSIKAQSTYVQYSVKQNYSNIQKSNCSVDDDINKKSILATYILVLDDLTSPFVVCKSKSKNPLKRETP